MTITIQDTFTDIDGTSLSAHDPDIGDIGSWEALGFSSSGGTLASDLQIQTNHCRPPNVNDAGSAYRNSTDPGADEYDFPFTFQFRASPQGNRFLVAYWRMTPTGTANGDVDRYVLFGDNTPTQEWTLQKVVAGTSTTLDSAPASLAGNSFAVVVQVRNGSMEVFLDGAGTPILSSTDIEITQRGRIGVGAARGDNDHWLDNLSVDSVSAGVDQDLNIPFHSQINQVFAPVIENQDSLNLSLGFIPSTVNIPVLSITNQAALELMVPFKASSATIFQMTANNEGDDLFEPTLAGNGSLVDQIFAGLIDQGFLFGSLADRERARLLNKLGLSPATNLSINDLYSLAVEDNRISGLGESVFA